MILGIDASTPGSGGGKRHLIELLLCFEPERHQFSKIVIWGGDALLLQLPEKPYFEKISHKFLNGGLFVRMYWQIFLRDKYFANQCDVLFSPFGTYTGDIHPFVAMSRNMLVFNKKERLRFGLSWTRIKLKLLYFTQIRVFKRADGLIFLSEYAKTEIAKHLDLSSKKVKIVHHGVSDKFRMLPRFQESISKYNEMLPFRVLYVSTIWVYKHPWNVVMAVARLREMGYPIVLDIVGNIEQKSSAFKLQEIIMEYDESNNFIFWHKDVSLDEVSDFYKKSDIFVFASSCENMPNILVEAMSSGLPIVCSSYPPMPEFLKESGIYFDPENVDSLQNSIELTIKSPILRTQISVNSYKASLKFTWKKCADQTFDYLAQIGDFSN
jgi:glycosyltransferase involved in cell wall biosynthesis